VGTLAARVQREATCSLYIDVFGFPSGCDGGAVLCGVDQARPAWAVHAAPLGFAKALMRWCGDPSLTSFRQLLREASSVMGVVRSLDHTSLSALLRR